MRLKCGRAKVLSGPCINNLEIVRLLSSGFCFCCCALEGKFIWPRVAQSSSGYCEVHVEDWSFGIEEHLFNRLLLRCLQGEEGGSCEVINGAIRSTTFDKGFPLFGARNYLLPKELEQLKKSRLSTFVTRHPWLKNKPTTVRCYPCSSRNLGGED